MAAEIDGYGNANIIPRIPEKSTDPNKPGYWPRRDDLHKKVQITVEAYPGNGGLYTSLVIQELLQKYMPGVSVAFTNNEPPFEPDVSEQIRTEIRKQIETGALDIAELYQPGKIQLALTRQFVLKELK